MSKKEIDKYPVEGDKKMIIGIIDTPISLLLTFFIGILLIPNNLWNSWTSYNIYLVLVIGYIVYRLICIPSFNSTIGMMIFKSEFLNEDGNKPSTAEKISIALFYSINGTKLYHKYN